jgi:farnesyl-diphosphate farnesyltransferase
MPTREMTGTGRDSRFDEATRFCRQVLPEVSRTFALSIKILPGQLGACVRCAYLLCRIADTVEDEPRIAAAAKAELLDAFAACFDDATAADEFPRRVASLTGDLGHLRLLARTDLVFVAYRALPPRSRDHLRRWVLEMVGGMRKFVLVHPTGIRIRTVEEYREYCYYVAGTVGYLLTDLWREHEASIGDREYAALRERCGAFAEALQTVNILKDVARDAEHENSIYIPESVLRSHGSSHATLLAVSYGAQNRAALVELAALAERDLDQATQYLLDVPRRAVAIRLFCALPLLFAYATLRDLRSGWKATDGGVVKISRREVKSIAALSFLSVLSNRAIARLVERTRNKPLLLGW